LQFAPQALFVQVFTALGSEQASPQPLQFCGSPVNPFPAAVADPGHIVEARKSQLSIRHAVASHLPVDFWARTPSAFANCRR
jgi:hypothetical protein